MQLYVGGEQAAKRLYVSILIRPEGRMQRPVSAGEADGGVFQSSSGQKAGCNPELERLGHIPAGLAVFQSSSGQKAGCNLSGSIQCVLR